MSKCIAFLRAINVSGRRIKMDYLCQLFEEMGFKNVETFIASGNVIFETSSKNRKELEIKIESSFQKTFGYRVATFIRTIDAVKEIANRKPFANIDQDAKVNTLSVAFLKEETSGIDKEKLLLLQTNIDEFCLDGNEIYWLNNRDRGESKFSGALLEKKLGMETTFRNIKTIIRITEKYS